MRDARLVQLFGRYRSKGDADALAKVFDEVAPALLKVARHIDGRAGEAEDLVQTTFLVAIERAASFDITRPLVPWLMGILINQSRLARRRRSRIDDSSTEETRSDSDLGVDLENRELATAVVSAMRGLPEVYQQVLMPHLTQGLKPGEIAELLGRPHGTVRAQIHRGIRMIRRILPAGFALGTAATMAGPGTMASVREKVLNAARERTQGGGFSASEPPRIASSSAKSVLRKCALGSAALVLGLGAWLFLRDARGGEAASTALGQADLSPRRERTRSPEPATKEHRTRTAVANSAAELDAEPYGEVVLHVTRAKDHSPGAGRHVTLLAWGEDEWYAHVLEGETEADGTAVFTHVHAGRVGIHIDHGQQMRDTVVAGQQLNVNIELPRGLDVAGRVVDRAGNPIAGATVETCARTGEAGAFASDETIPPSALMPRREPPNAAATNSGAAPRTQRCTTRPDGSFVISDVDRKLFLFAHANGHAASELYWLDAPRYRETDRVGLEIVLSEAALSVSGRVLNARGAPVAGARVLIHHDAAGSRGADHGTGEVPRSAVLSNSSLETPASDSNIASDVRAVDSPSRVEHAETDGRESSIAGSSIRSSTGMQRAAGTRSDTTSLPLGSSSERDIRTEGRTPSSEFNRSKAAARSHGNARSETSAALETHTPARPDASGGGSANVEPQALPPAGRADAFDSSASTDAQFVAQDATPNTDVRSVAQDATANTDVRSAAQDATTEAASARARCFADGSVRIDAAPLCVSTDEQGRFSSATLPSGDTTVRVEALGFAPWCTRIDGGTGDRDGLVVHLTSGVTLHGTVKTRDGGLAEGAIVSVRSPAARSPQTIRTSADGGYVLEHVAPGEIVLSARAFGFGEPTSAMFMSRDGESLEWNPVIERELVIEGSVIGADDRPVKIWLVKAVPEDLERTTARDDHAPMGQELTLEDWLEREIFDDPAPDLLQCWTDDRGRFRVPCRGHGPHRLELRPRKGWAGPPKAALSGVRPGMQGVVLRYAPSGSWVRGTLALPRCAETSACELIAIQTQDGNVSHFSSDATTGEFQFGPLPEGRYEIIAWANGCLPQSLGRHDLARGAALNLGLWRLAGNE